MSAQFEGRVAVVTGGARGLGYAMARTLAAHGAAVALLDVLPELGASAQRLAAESGRPTLAVPVDVTDEGAVQAAFARVGAELGTAHILLNAAGVALVEPALSTTADQWRRLMDVNVTGTFVVCREFARAAIAAGAEGAIVNVSSMSGYIVNVPQQQAAYNASKAAVSMLTASLAVEWLEHGIRVNAIGPGYFASDMTKTVAEQQPQMAAFWNSRIPMGRMGSPTSSASWSSTWSGSTPGMSWARRSSSTAATRSSEPAPDRASRARRPWEDGAMTLKDTIQHDLHDAMRARDQVRSGTLRMALTAIQTAQVAGTTAHELDDDEVLRVLAKEAKKRKESAAAYADAGRPELAERENAELAILEGYLPAQLSDDELAAIAAQAVADVGATGMQQMGQVMKAAQQSVAGRADGGRVAAAVKKALA